MKLLSIPQAAAALRVTPSLVRRWCRQGRLGVRVGGRWVIAQDDLARFAALPRQGGWPKGKARGKKGQE